MTKILFVFATLALLAMAQTNVGINAEVTNPQAVNANGGEVITENVELEITTVIPKQPVVENNLINVEEVVLITETAVPNTEDTTIVNQHVNVEENVIIQQTEAPVEEVTLVQEHVTVQQGNEANNIINVGEVVVVEESAPVVENVKNVEQTIVVEENILVHETLPALTETIILEENIILQGAEQPNTIIVEEYTVGGGLEQGEAFAVGGGISGSLNGNLRVNDWHFNGGSLVSIPAVLSLVLGATILIS